MKVIKCPHCEAQVVDCDNNVYLDYPAVPYDERTAGWTLMSLGGMNVASVGNPGIGGTGHSLHIHQPPESIMA